MYGNRYMLRKLTYDTRPNKLLTPHRVSLQLSSSNYFLLSRETHTPGVCAISFLPSISRIFSRKSLNVKLKNTFRLGGARYHPVQKERAAAHPSISSSHSPPSPSPSPASWPSSSSSSSFQRLKCF